MGNFLTAVPDEEDLGPAMRECTVAEREFIVAMFQTGARNQTEAAMLTGRYADRGSANAAAARWMSKPRVLAGLDEFSTITMKWALPASTRALIEIVMDPLHKDRFKAAVELQNRNGHIVETINRHIVEDHRDMKEIVKSTVDLARQMGDVRLAYKLLGTAVPKEVIDAEFSEVDPLEGLYA